MCEMTGETSDGIGPTCRYGFPDAFNTRSLFLELFTLCDFSDGEDDCANEIGEDTANTGDSEGDDSTSTADICRVYSNVIDNLGCCYNSLYNDTEFIGFLSAQVMNQSLAQDLINLGQSTVWDQCMIDVPMCGSATLNDYFAVNILLVISIIVINF